MLACRSWLVPPARVILQSKSDASIIPAVSQRWPPLRDQVQHIDSMVIRCLFLGSVRRASPGRPPEGGRYRSGRVPGPMCPDGSPLCRSGTLRGGRLRVSQAGDVLSFGRPSLRTSGSRHGACMRSEPVVEIHTLANVPTTKETPE